MSAYVWCPQYIVYKVFVGIGSAAQRHVNNMNLHSNMFEMCLYQRQNMFTNAINECDVVFAFCEHVCLCLDKIAHVQVSVKF